MEFSVARDVLAEAVSWTSRNLPQRPATPILSGVRFQVSGEEIELSTFDYEVSSRVIIPAVEITTGGEVIVSGKLLGETARLLPSSHNTVTFQLEGNRMSVTCGPFHTSLVIMNIEEYPQLPTPPALAGRVESAVLSQAVSQVSIAAARDETLPLLTGVCVEMRPHSLSLLATDRYRLALREIPWEAVNQQLDQDILIRARTLSEAAKSITSTGQVDLAMDSENPHLIGFSAGGRLLTSQLNDGQYPDVRKLFPEDIKTYAVVDAHHLIESVKRVSLVSFQNKQISLRFTEGNLLLEAGDHDENQSSENMPAHLMGEEIALVFNPNYLLEGLSSLTTPYARFSFTEATKPAVITGQEKIGEEDKQDYKYLIMPIRLGM